MEAGSEGSREGGSEGRGKQGARKHPVKPFNQNIVTGARERGSEGGQQACVVVWRVWVQAVMQVVTERPS